MPRLLVLLGSLLLALATTTSPAQMSAEERKKMREKEVVGYLKGQRPADDKNKTCVYDVFGKERIMLQDKSLPCPRELKFPPNR